MTVDSRGATALDAAGQPAPGVPSLFVPGIIMPAALRYAPLIAALGEYELPAR